MLRADPIKTSNDYMAISMIRDCSEEDLEQILELLVKIWLGWTLNREGMREE
jgi:hypothetical protein